MLKHSILIVTLGLCIVAAVVVAASPSDHQEQAAAVNITAVELTVAVDRDAPCYLSFRGTIRTTGEGTVWYRFEGPAGITFDAGAEGTMDVVGTGGGVGKGGKMSQDIQGQFRLEAAMVDANGKRGPSAFSNSVPANYTCGGGTSVAKPVKTPSAAAVIAKVTAAALKDVRTTYNGPCPSYDAVSATITTDGPGTVWYRIYSNSAATVFPDGPDGTVTFTAAGSQVVTKRIAIARPHRGQFRIQASMEVSPGRHGALTISAPVDFEFNCTTGGPPPEG